ncbi:MAG TPA: hypothetical protein VFV38_04025 [Ktedonobacteraceae bacterium]|nr:hypothetical protein [Ktedonobacteraceae bacterium]
MKKSLSLLCVVRWHNKRVLNAWHIMGRSSRRVGLFCLAAGLFLISLFFSACSSPFGGNSSSTPTSTTQGLNHISWCEKPSMIFRDEGAITPTATHTATATATPTGTATVASGTPVAGPGTPSTISDWSVVKANLGFTIYLPASLPRGSCLVSAQATIHDPIFGGNFTIGYLLADHTSLSFSEAPLKSQSMTFQCDPTSSATPKAGGTPVATPTTGPTSSQLCSGAKDTTNIVLSGPGTTQHLQQIFNGLQPNVNWIPNT